MWSQLLCCTFMVSLLFSHAHGQFVSRKLELPEIKDSETVMKDWKKVENLIKTAIKELSKTAMPTVMDSMQNANITLTCLKDTLRLFGGIRKLEPWALKFADSSAKGLDGIFSGSFSAYGSFDECVNNVATKNSPGKHEEVLFTGRHCTIQIKPAFPKKKDIYKSDNITTGFENNTLVRLVAEYEDVFEYVSLKLGLCIPSGCSEDDVNQILSNVISDYPTMYAKVRTCSLKEDATFKPSALNIAIICYFTLTGFVVLFATAVDVYNSYFKKIRNQKSMQLYQIHSLIPSFQKFMDTSTSSTSLSALNGIRFFSMTWVILSHTYAIPLTTILSNTQYAREKAENFSFQIILQGDLAVETFFFLSGLLVCYVATNHVIIAKRQFSIRIYIIHRLFRIIPGYVFALMLLFLTKCMVSGPLVYDVLEPFVHECYQNWWTTFVFINNFYYTYMPCMIHGWYLAADMQLYVGALIILLPLFKWPKVGICIATVCLISSIVTCGVVTYIWDYPPATFALRANVEKLQKVLLELYIKPYPHVAPYVLGMLVGYLLARNSGLKVPKVLLWFGWPAAIICSASSLYGVYAWNSGRGGTLVEVILYASLHRFAWTVGVAWMVVCCATGNGGIVNYILSWKIWIPLGRLTFMVYLVHLPIQLAFLGSMRNPLDLTNSLLVWLFFGTVVVSYAVAFLGTMLIESPLLAVEKILLNRAGEKMRKKSETNSNIKETVNGKDVDSLKRKRQAHELPNGTENPGDVVTHI